MRIGIAATCFETEAFILGAANLDDKRRRIAENKRKDLTVDQVLGWVDNEHFETAGICIGLGTCASSSQSSRTTSPMFPKR
jgi:hypothetical protein